MRKIVDVIKLFLNNSLTEAIVLLYWKYSSRKIRLARVSLEQPSFVLGPTPIINNKHWKTALQSNGFEAHTVVRFFYENINKKSDFDFYVSDYDAQSFFHRFLLFAGNLKWLTKAQDLLAFDVIVRKYDVQILTYEGGYLNNTFLKGREVEILKLFGVKTIVIPFGGDFFRMSELYNKTYQHAYLYHYPSMVNNERKIKQRLDYWQKNADFTVFGYTLDGVSRWDALKFVLLSIDTDVWKRNKNRESSKTVRIAHSPNHRKLKGTDFIVKAVEELKEEGLDIELVLLEGMKNDEIKRVLTSEVDVFVEQLILSGYGLSGIEAMSCSLPVLSCIEDSTVTKLFRRHSYLNECPVLSATPETIKDNLRIICIDSELRKVLGLASRKYVEKYYSSKAFSYFISMIIEKLYFNPETNLMDLYDPLVENSYNNLSPQIDHPLVENRLSREYFTSEKK